MSYTVLISGASRGIGLEFVKEYLQDGWHTIACCRKPDAAEELHDLKSKYKNLDIHALDVTNSDQINQLAKDLSNTPIDVLIHNAGIYGDHDVTFGHIGTDNLQRVFMTNAAAPLKISEALYNNVKNSTLKKIVYISSRIGSIADNTTGKAYAYRASKAAGNMLIKSMAIDVLNDGIHVLILHPGWVKTDMGGPNALITVTESVSGMRNVIDQENLPSGSFFSYDGKAIPW